MLKNAILQAAARSTESVRRHRGHLHRHPEPSFSETRTGAYVSDALTALGIQHGGQDEITPGCECYENMAFGALSLAESRLGFLVRLK